MFGITINRCFGFSLRLPNGFAVGWNWTHDNEGTTKTMATIASYHHPRSITWRWVVYYHTPKIHGLKSFLPSYGRYRDSLYVGLGALGSISVFWQEHMFRSLESKP